MKKKTVKKIIGWTVVLLLAAGLAVLPTLARKAAEGTQASILSAKAEQGEIEHTLAGGGTLTAEDPIEVKIPETVEILKYLVENGDHVEEGQALAEVDRVTLMGAMAEVQDSLDSLAEQMRDEGSGTRTSVTLSAQAAGRVKAIYAQKGDDVRRVMLEHGALAVLSLDGMMVTEIETGLPVPAGSALQLQLSDGKTVTGRVQTVLDGKLTVVLSDDGPRLGDTVTAFAEDGTEVGRGTLAVHSAWNLIALDGTVSQVYIRENEAVYDGRSLLQLDRTAGSTEYQSLAAKHGEYETLMDDLFRLYTDNIVRAPAAGFVNDIDESKIKDTAAAGMTAGIRLLANEAGCWLGTILSVGENGSFTARVIPYSGTLPKEPAKLMELALMLSAGTEMSFSDCEQAASLSPGSVAAILSDGGSVSVTPVDLFGAISGTENAMPGNGAAGMGGFAIITIPSGGGGTAAQTGGEEESDGLYEKEEKTILTITPDNAMTVSIDVDELDILQYETGMQADVTVDALPDRSFTAEVIEISPLGKNSGGNSKFQVKLQLDRAPDMLDGMNASVVVHGGKKTGLLLPVAAIHDRGSKSYVYTALDSKTGEPTLEMPVTTGLSDGEKVEVLSGVREGQPVFYQYYVGSRNGENTDGQ